MMSNMKNTAENMKKKKFSMLMEAYQKMNMMKNIGHHITGASLVDQYPIMLVHIAGFKIIKN